MTRAGKDPWLNLLSTERDREFVRAIRFVTTRITLLEFDEILNAREDFRSVGKEYFARFVTNFALFINKREGV